MKVWLVLYIISRGVDVGPPPILTSSMDECQEVASRILERGVPVGADLMRVGCLQEIGGERS